MHGKRSRMRHTRTHTAKLHPAAIVGICLAAAVILTVVVGNLLKHLVDDETYRRLTEGEKSEPTSEVSDNTRVRNVNAYPFTLGEDVTAVIRMPAVSVNLNTPSGKVLYTSDVVQYQGLESDEAILLSETLPELRSFVAYASGVYYPQAFGQASADLRYAVALEESALLREFVHMGGSDVLLRGLPLTAADMDAVAEYLTAVKNAVDNAPVGVAVPLSVVQSEGGWEILNALLENCDYCALDVTDAPLDPSDVDEFGVSPSALSLLQNTNYYISQYGMRVLLSSSQATLLSTLEYQMHQNYQVIYVTATEENADTSTQ